jgi:hypothetical protein
MINEVMSSELEHKAAPESVSRNCGFEILNKPKYRMKISIRKKLKPLMT